MMNNSFDFNSLIRAEVQRQVEDRISELKPQIIVKEKETIKENLEQSMKCYTVPEVAKNFFRCDVNVVWKLIKTGKLRAMKLKTTKVAACEIYRFLNENAGADFDDILNS